MNKQEFEEYRPTLAEFVEKFVAHNSTVYLYEKWTKYVDTGEGCKQKVTRWQLIWKGMDWQITYGKDDEDYFIAHPEVEKCPYRNCKKPIEICSVMPFDKKFPDAVDDIGVCFQRYD